MYSCFCEFFFWSNVYVSFGDYICNTMLVVIILQFPLHVTTTHNKCHVVEHGNHVLLVMSRRVTKVSLFQKQLLSVQLKTGYMQWSRGRQKKRNRKGKSEENPHRLLMNLSKKFNFEI
uniref:Uncharacterized protein n=1 Tax=Brassica oleracea TaxID=3712 RepID=A0A3P6CIA9_BRAOL|nr:unnamed protein product [Brassica oleracea]